MNDIRYRFAVESPLQLLMAEEASLSLDLDPIQSELVLLFPSEELAVTTMNDLASRLEWGRIVDTGRRSRLRQPIRLLEIMRLTRAPVERLVIGDYYSPPMRHLANRHTGPVTLVDDGRATIGAARERNGAADPVSHRSLRPLTLVAARIAGLDFSTPEAVDFFSMFDLDVTPPDTMTKNDLRGLRSSVSAKPVRQESILLGGPFVELGQMSDGTYEALLAEAVELSDVPVTIYPHRRESSEKLQRLRSAGFHIVESEAPIELRLLSEPTIPVKIASFFSTATYTLWRMLPKTTSFVSYQLGPADIDPRSLANGDPSQQLKDQMDGSLTIQPLGSLRQTKPILRPRST